jgi:hypothetical protein
LNPQVSQASITKGAAKKEMPKVLFNIFYAHHTEIRIQNHIPKQQIPGIHPILEKQPE